MKQTSLSKSYFTDNGMYYNVRKPKKRMIVQPKMYISHLYGKGVGNNYLIICQMPEICNKTSHKFLS